VGGEVVKERPGELPGVEFLDHGLRVGQRAVGEAQAEMNAWGYADLLAKVTTGADWILADALGVEAIDPLAWNIVQGRLREAVADPAGVRAYHPATLHRARPGGACWQTGRLPERDFWSERCVAYWAANPNPNPSLIWRAMALRGSQEKTSR